jgi:hypothetical protein
MNAGAGADSVLWSLRCPAGARHGPRCPPTSSSDRSLREIAGSKNISQAVAGGADIAFYVCAMDGRAPRGSRGSDIQTNVCATPRKRVAHQTSCVSKTAAFPAEQADMKCTILLCIGGAGRTWTVLVTDQRTGREARRRGRRSRIRAHLGDSARSRGLRRR